MADTLESHTSDSDAALASAANQARLRKERREAKIRSGGSARLNKITGLGGVRRDFSSPDSSRVHADPEEVDISNLRYNPETSALRTEPHVASTPVGISSSVNEDVLRQMMLGINSSTMSTADGHSVYDALGAGPNHPAGLDDPMMKMFQQMISGNSGDGMRSMPAFPGLESQPPSVSTSSYAYVWRVVHAVFALSLGLFVACTSQFTGTKFERERSGLGYTSADSELLISRPIHFFYVFLVVEVMLLSSRFLLDKEQVQPEGIIGMALGFLSDPMKRYVLLVMRYISIWNTVSRDAMVCVFVLGVYAWLKGANN